MKKIENTALQMIAEASRCPDYGPDMVKSLMKKLDMSPIKYGYSIRSISRKVCTLTRSPTFIPRKIF